MKLKKIAQCLSVATLLCSVQAFAASAPLDSAPTAVNFSGEVTTATCAIVGTSANQIITLPDMTMNQATNMPTSGLVVGNKIPTTIDFTQCSNLSGPTGSLHRVKLVLSGAPGTANSGKSFAKSSGAASGLDFALVIQPIGLNSAGVASNYQQPQIMKPNVSQDVIYPLADNGVIPDNVIYRVPLDIGVYRNASPVISGDMSMVANITITNV